MKTVAPLVLVAVAAASPLAAQQNPFKLSAGSVKSAVVDYTLSGDETGTEELAFTPERWATRTNSTTRVFGKDTKVNRLDVATLDSVYSVDLDKKEGFRGPSPARIFAEEYDHLSAAEKKRLQSNAEEMASVFAQAFGAGALSEAAEVKGHEIIAGHKCELHEFFGFTSCTLVDAPGVPLRVQGEIFCLRMHKEATSVSLNGAVPADRFAVPADIKWKTSDPMSEEDARKLIRYMASQELADSLAKAKQEIAAAQDSARARAAAQGNTAQVSDTLTTEQREEMCKVMREGIQLHVKVTPPDPGKMVQQGVNAEMASARAWANALLSNVEQEAKERAKEGVIRKLKPKFP